MSTQGALFKCLRTFQKGYTLNCAGKDQFCCNYFQRNNNKKSTTSRSSSSYSHRRAKKLFEKPKIFKIQEQPPKKSTSTFIDYDFKRLHKEKKHFNDFMEQNEIETSYEPKFNGGQRRGIVLEESNSNKNDFNNNTEAPPPRAERLQQKKLFQFHDPDQVIGDQGYDRDLCASLRVPCRFVNDHPCCQFEMPMDLVARARSLDGSADIKWRPVSLGGPRSSQGRSLFKSIMTPTLPPSIVNKEIKYNFAKNKKKVQIPKYHYDGGPEMTSTIVGLCWRLHYLRCPNKSNYFENNIFVVDKNTNDNWIESRHLKKIHPCCQLVNKPLGGKSNNSPYYDNRIAKWLNLVR